MSCLFFLPSRSRRCPSSPAAGSSTIIARTMGTHNVKSKCIPVWGETKVLLRVCASRATSVLAGGFASIATSPKRRPRSSPTLDREHAHSLEYFRVK